MFWTVELEGGPQRVNHAAVSVGDKIYSFGGYCTGENYQAIVKYGCTCIEHRWKAIEIQQGRHMVPFQRYGHTAVAFGPLVYVWGGRNDNTACNILYCFDTNTHLWSVPKVGGTVPEARDGHSACVINDHMYVFSGYLEYMEAYTQDLHTLNLRTMTELYQDNCMDGTMYVWGGREVASGWYNSQANEQYRSELHALDTATNQWGVVPCTGAIPEGRRSHSAFVYKDQMYVFGGFNSRKEQHFNDLHRYDPVTHCWENVKPLGVGPCPRRRQSCCVVGSKMFLFGGTSPKENFEESIPLEDHEIYGEELTDRTLKDHNDLHVLDFEPSLKTLCLLRVQALKLDTSWLPRELQALLQVMSLPNNITTDK